MKGDRTLNKRAQRRMPIVEALLEYQRQQTISFHVPGHKHGAGLPNLTRLWGKTIFGHDLTIMPDMDSIYKPHGVIAEAQRLAADAFKAEHAFFMVNGTTSAIQGMLMAALDPGDKVIVPRNVHKSIVSGLILSGAEPIYVQPPVDDYLGVVRGMTADIVRQALRQYPETKAIFTINTTYYGMSPELEAICEIAHEHGIPVLVDEAHGAHLAFHPLLPPAGMEVGADAVASSTHKLAGSLTQSSMLLTRGPHMDPLEVKSTLNLTQTTSPSYLLLASLDAARQHMFFHGEELLTEAMNLANWARHEINWNIPGLYVYGNDMVGMPGCPAYDPTKLVISVRALGVSGFEVERILRQGFHIQVDLSDLYNVLAVVTIGDTKETVRALVEALRQIASRFKPRDVREEKIELPPIPSLAYLPREAYYSETRKIPLVQAAGRIVAEMLMAYPPGIPLIAPGEILTQDIIDYVLSIKEQDAHIYGTEDPTAEFIRVIR
ncbi:MAG TPA: aminotransferase class I/II-fold pyridoxal phosphate-dependent enzyme [Firmicutes bacterium]|jgi:arginine decarboxylase|nr:aminotransferase class I/II-fold pyridoxal phosphate-dependent enzyme [Bacillota bacterium]